MSAYVATNGTRVSYKEVMFGSYFQMLNPCSTRYGQNETVHYLRRDGNPMICRVRRENGKLLREIVAKSLGTAFDEIGELRTYK
jgi:hypothetical protein